MASLRETVVSWDKATLLFNDGCYKEASDVFSSIEEEQKSSKIFFNIACANAVIEKYEDALQYFTKATEKDENLVVGYYQKALVYYLCKRYKEAVEAIEMAKIKMMGRQLIKYHPVRLKVILSISQILCTMAYFYILNHEKDKAISALTEAKKYKITEGNLLGNIEKALGHRNLNMDNAACLLQEIPFTLIFLPEKALVSNVKKKDYLGKARVVSAIDVNDQETGFMGPKLISKSESNLLDIPKPEERLQRSRTPPPAIRYPPQPMRPPPRIPKKTIQKSTEHVTVLSESRNSQSGRLKASGVENPVPAFTPPPPPIPNTKTFAKKKLSKVQGQSVPAIPPPRHPYNDNKTHPDISVPQVGMVQIQRKKLENLQKN